MVNKKSDVVINFRTVFNGLDKGVDNAKKKLNGFKTTAQTSGKSLEDTGKKTRDLGDDFRELGEDIEETSGKIKKRVASAAKTLAGFAVASGIALGIRSATKAFVDFEQQLSDISTLIGGDSTKAVGELRDGITDLIKRVPKDPSELGAAAYQILSAGITDTTLALETLEASSKLSVAGLGTVSEATNLMTSALNAFAGEGLTASDAANTLFLAVANGKTTVAELTRGFGAVAGQVAATGIKFNDFIATVSALTTVGLPATQAYTQVRAALAGLTRETETSIDVFGRLGVRTFKELVQQAGGLTPAFQAIRAEVGDNDAEMLKLVGSVEALNAIISVSDVVGDAYTTTLDQMENQTEALDVAFGKQTETMKSQAQILKNQLTAAFFQLGNEIIPQVTAVLKDLTDAGAETDNGISLLTITIRLFGAAFTAIFQTLVVVVTLFKDGLVATFIIVETQIKATQAIFKAFGSSIFVVFNSINNFMQGFGGVFGNNLRVAFENPLETVKLSVVKGLNFLIGQFNKFLGTFDKLLDFLPKSIQEKLGIDGVKIQLPKIEEPDALADQFQSLSGVAEQFKKDFNFEGIGTAAKKDLRAARDGLLDLENVGKDSLNALTRAYNEFDRAGKGVIESFDPNNDLDRQRQNAANSLGIQQKLQEQIQDLNQETQDKAGGAAEKAKKKSKDLNDLTDKELESLGKKAVKVWEDYEKGVDKSEAAIGKLEKKQADLIESFRKQLRDATQDIVSSEKEAVEELAAIYVDSGDRIKEIRKELKNIDEQGGSSRLVDQLLERQKREKSITDELERRKQIEADGGVTFGIAQLERDAEAEGKKVKGLELRIEKEIALAEKQGESTGELSRQVELLKELSDLTQEQADSRTGIGVIGADFDQSVADAAAENEKSEAEKLNDKVAAERAIFEEQKSILEALQAGEEINLDEIQNYENLKLAEQQLAKLDAIEIQKQTELDKIAEIEKEFLDSLKVVETEELASILRRKGAYEALVQSINEAISARNALEALSNSSESGGNTQSVEVPAFEQGGETSFSSGSGLALLHDKEFVVKAKAAQPILPILKAVNAGQSLGSVVQAATPENLAGKVTQLSQTTNNSTQNMRNDSVNIYTNTIENPDDLFDQFNARNYQ